MTKITSLEQITQKELELIPNDKIIAIQPISIEIEGDRYKSIIKGCPIEHANAYIVVGEKIRTFSMLFGERVYDDNFRDDFDRIAASEGYHKNHPARKYVQTHGYGGIPILDIIYVAKL